MKLFRRTTLDSLLLVYSRQLGLLIIILGFMVGVYAIVSLFFLERTVQEDATAKPLVLRQDLIRHVQTALDERERSYQAGPAR